MLCFVRFVSVAALGCLAGSVSAETYTESTLGGGLSLFGPTLEGTYQIEPDTRLRGVLIGGLSYSDAAEDDDGNNYAIDASVSAAALLVDFFPNGPGWRVSGGVMFNMSDFEALGAGGPIEPFEINGRTYSGGEVAAEVTFANQIAPMVTTGYDYQLNDDWVISGEVGLIYTGGLEVDAIANSAALQDEIDNNPDYRDFRDDAADLAVLPYISIAVGFRF